jgi:3-dehydro-L-gulonate 2-dehydrogenase
MPKVPYGELRAALQLILLKEGFDEPRALLCAELFTQTSCDGVYTHGVDRFPRFLRTIHNGTVRVNCSAQCMKQVGALEQWNGNSGPGNLNAFACMQRAVELSREHGLGCVALANSTHWMRGGTYGWQAADTGAIGICWTNTLPNLPPWGASKPLLGNNPFVIAVPREGGHVVLDMAMSQFSFGALEAYRERGQMLPVPGGFDLEGMLTSDPAGIEASQRPLPIGYWKGSGLAMMLDLVAAIMSGGCVSAEVTSDPDREGGVSQVFIAVDVRAIGGVAASTRIAEKVIASIRQSGNGEVGGQVRYPGERVLNTRRENMLNGIPVKEEIWRQLNAEIRR